MANLSQAGLQVTDASMPTLSEKIGLELERKPTAPPLGSQVFTPRSFAASPVLQDMAPQRAHDALVANDSIARESAATLALAFRGSLAPIRRIIRDSQSPSEVEEKVKQFYADWSLARVAPLIEEALIAYAANGAVVAPETPRS